MLETVDLSFPDLPPALEGLRMAHVTDLHVRRVRRVRRRDRTIADRLARSRFDLLVLTGDYMERRGDEEAAAEALKLLCEAVQPRLGIFGAFGNHDTEELVDRAADLPIHWLDDRAVWVERGPILLAGLRFRPNENSDLLALTASLDRVDAAIRSRASGGTQPFRMLLSHMPHYVTSAADMGFQAVFAGHTHGGQIRLPTGHALVNSSELPLRLTSGILRHRNTLAAVSRGVGMTKLPLRLFCPPQLPIYNLRRASMPGQFTQGVACVRRW